VRDRRAEQRHAPVTRAEQLPIEFSRFCRVRVGS